MALLAAQAQDALLEPTALQVSLELLLNESWKRPAGLGAQFAKRGVVLLDELIQQRGFGSVAGMAGVAATVGDARGYGPTSRKGRGKSGVSSWKCSCWLRASAQRQAGACMN
jgi:hypothetical protein